MGTTILKKSADNKSARNRAERHARRHDPDIAREALKELWPISTVRRTVSTLIATSIKVAHAEAPSSWELTLHPHFVRLNVGQVAVLDLYSDDARVYAVHGVRPGGAEFERLPYGQYDAVDAETECWACPPESSGRIARRFISQHHELIRIAARAKGVSPFKKSHSPGVVTALAAICRMALPEPDYATVADLGDEWLDDGRTEVDASRTDVGWATRPSKEVEEAAVRIVTQRLEADGWKVRSVEADLCGYDLHCERRGKWLHVEVKGSAGPSARFIMTRNELRRAAHDVRFELFLVGRANSDEPIIRRWRGPALLSEHVVEPTQFELRPHSKLERD